MRANHRAVDRSPLRHPSFHHRVAHQPLDRGDHQAITGNSKGAMIGKRVARLGVFALVITLVAGVSAVAGTAKKAPQLTGSITADGSSTVGPWASAAAEMYRKFSRRSRSRSVSGTGGGFEKFCRGEIDLANASRAIKSTEYAKCRENGVKWVAFTVANDGITLVTSSRTPGRPA